MFSLIFLGGVAVYAYFKWIKPNQNWLSWPTLEQYWERYPQCRTGSGIKCQHCGSKHLRHQGWTKRNDDRRIHTCNQCNTTLYRTRG